MVLLSASHAAFACFVKSCAPPPAGKGGSSKAGYAARAEAKKVLKAAMKVEGEVTKNLRGLIGGESGIMVGLKHRVKGLKSLTRKIHDKAMERGQSMEESASRISDALRFTAVAHSSKYSSLIRNTIKKLKQAGYDVHELETHWKRGDAYNGVHAVVKHPSGVKIELQFHTTQSWAAKMKTHKMYEEFRQHDTTPQRRTELAKQMVQIADSARIPSGALSHGARVYRPVEG